MGTIQLRDYQAETIAAARDSLRSARRVLIQSPTGSGKTPMAGYMASSMAAANQPAFFICNRAELVQQTVSTFHRFGIDHGIIAAGYPMDLRQQVQICSIDTLKGRLQKLPIRPRWLLWDECHHIAAAGWARVMEYYADARHIGFSATPERLDGKGLGDFFDVLVPGPQVGWLIERGYLSDYEYYAPPAPADLRARGKDDDRGGQAKVLDKPKLIGDVVKHWQRCANGMRTVGFACNVQHSLHMVEAFNAAGIPAAHLDGDTPKGERKRIIDDFAAGKILVLWNVSLFGEGFDLAAIAGVDVTIDCVILNRKTQSLSWYLQMVGRALRPAPGKVAVILDHAGNLKMHDFPDCDREWSLEGRAKGSRAANDNGPPPPVDCTNCWRQLRVPLPDKCPHCGETILKPALAIPKVGEGELVKQTAADKRAIRAQLMREQMEAKSLGELAALGARRGYKEPLKWAQSVMGGRRRNGTHG